MQVYLPIVVLLLICLIIIACVVFYIRRRRPSNDHALREQDGGINGCLQFASVCRKRPSSSKCERSALESIPLNTTNMVENPSYLKFLHSHSAMGKSKGLGPSIGLIVMKSIWDKPKTYIVIIMFLNR